MLNRVKSLYIIFNKINEYYGYIDNKITATDEKNDTLKAYGKDGLI